MNDAEVTLRLRTAKEDCLASNGSVGVAVFVESILTPLEAQGRGLAHGRKKVNSVPNHSAAKLKYLCRKGTAALQAADRTLPKDSFLLAATSDPQTVLQSTYILKQEYVSTEDGDKASTSSATRNLRAVTLTELRAMRDWLTCSCQCQQQLPADFYYKERSAVLTMDEFRMPHHALNSNLHHTKFHIELQPTS